MSGNLMTLEEFYNLHKTLGNNDVILDVRNPDEYQAAHIKNALNIPVTEISAHIEKLKKFDHIYIHCKRGGRAKTAYDVLKNAGLTNLVCIHDAGMDLWLEKGFPVEKD